MTPHNTPEDHRLQSIQWHNWATLIKVPHILIRGLEVQYTKHKDVLNTLSDGDWIHI
jgi:hypothetical protein